MIVPCLATVSPVVIGGDDTHKELHVAAVVDSSDVLLGTKLFATTRAGSRAMLRWMRSFGDVKRIGVECTGSYGAGLMRFLEHAGIEVLEVTAPDQAVRRKKGKDDTLDAGNAAQAAQAGIRTVTLRTRDGMVESLRVLRVARKTAVAARRVALQMLQTQIVSAPEELRDQVRNLTRMQLVRTIAAWRPDATDQRDVTTATRLALRSLARRYLELTDEIAELDGPIKAKKSSTLNCSPAPASGSNRQPNCSSPLATILNGCVLKPALPRYAAFRRYQPLPEKRLDIASTELGIGQQTQPCT